MFYNFFQKKCSCKFFVLDTVDVFAVLCTQSNHGIRILQQRNTDSHSRSAEERHAAELVTGLTGTAAALLTESFWLEPAAHCTQLFTRDEELSFHNSPWLIYNVFKLLSVE